MPYLGRKIQRKSSFRGPARLGGGRKSALHQSLDLKCAASRNNVIRSREQPNLHNSQEEKQRAARSIRGVIREAVGMTISD
jgi:hypothetical protein